MNPQMKMPSSLKPKNPQQQSQTAQFSSTLKPKQQQKLEKPHDPFEEDLETEKEVERNIAQQTSRMGETILGLPGDIESLGRHLLGSKSDTLFPTSQNLRSLSEKASQGYTSPKNEGEERAGEFMSDVASMMIPGGGHYSMARNIGIPIVANLAKEGIKYTRAGEKAQAYGKVGTMVALDLVSRRTGGVKSYMSDLFKKGEESIPQGISVNASKLESNIKNLQKELLRGGSRPSTEAALVKTNEILGDIKNGKIDVKSLSKYRPSINEIIEEVGGFNMKVPFKSRPKAMHHLNEVKNEVIKTLSEYGEKFNPEFNKYNSSANEAWAAYANSNKITKFIQDKLGFIPKSNTAATLFNLGPHVAPALLGMGPVTAAAATTGAAGYQAFRILNRVLNSKTLSKYYGNAIKDSLAGNVAGATKNLKALDENLLQEESSQVQ